MVAIALPTSVDSSVSVAACLPNITRLVVANMYNISFEHVFVQEVLWSRLPELSATDLDVNFSQNVESYRKVYAWTALAKDLVRGPSFTC